jgi:hypothetical protein
LLEGFLDFATLGLSVPALIQFSEPYKHRDISLVQKMGEQ